MCPEDLVVLVTTISLAIAKDKSTDELDLLSAIFVLVGDNLATYSTQLGICEACSESSKKNTSSTDSSSNTSSCK